MRKVEQLEKMVAELETQGQKQVKAKRKGTESSSSSSSSSSSKTASAKSERCPACDEKREVKQGLRKKVSQAHKKGCSKRTRLPGGGRQKKVAA